MTQDFAATQLVAIEHAIRVYDIPSERIAAFQQVCRHSAQNWVEVSNIPPARRQYGDDEDWICMTCGAQIPAFC
jgi:hypothetical protein